MSGIVCAIRGGPSSHPTIERAISLAKETKLPLYFIYVINLEFFVHTQTGRVHTAEKQLLKMGEFILLTAQAKAEEEGVVAEGLVRQGIIGEEIITVSNEIEANYVVLGSPKGAQDVDHFTQDHFAEFVQRIKGETMAQVMYPNQEN
jgi:nucleotide-binding universal stress UspA family protein